MYIHTFSGISVNLHRSAKGSPSLKLLVDGDIKLRHSFNHRDMNLRWELKPALWEPCCSFLQSPDRHHRSVLQEQSTLIIRVSEHPLMRSTKTISEVSISFDDAQQLLLVAGGECKGDSRPLFVTQAILMMFYKAISLEMIQKLR